MNNTIITYLAVYWLIATIHIYTLLPKYEGEKLASFFWAFFTAPLLCPIKLFIDAIHLITDDSKIQICRRSTGDKK